MNSGSFGSIFQESSRVSLYQYPCDKLRLLKNWARIKKNKAFDILKSRRKSVTAERVFEISNKRNE